MKNKKGQVSLNLVSGIVVGLFVLAMIAVAIFAGADNIINSNLFTSGSQPLADTTNSLNNVTSATTSFFENADTFLTILAVVLIMSFIGLMIFVVTRFSGRGTGQL